MMFKWLNDFIALANAKQFSSAADSLYISQSALSKHIKALEEEVGTELFTRSNVEVDLTEAGKIYLEYALKIQELIREFQYNLEQKNLTSKTVHITIASIPCAAECGIIQSLLEFQKQNDNFTLECFEADQNEMFGKLSSGEIDVAICRIDFISQKEYDIVPLVDDQMVLVCKKGLYPFAEGSEVDLKAFPLNNLYTIAQESEIYRLAQKQLRVCGLEENFAGTAHRHMILLSMLSSAQDSCALLPRKIFNQQLYPNLTYYNIKNAVSTQIGLVRLKKVKVAEKTDAMFKYFSFNNCNKNCIDYLSSENRGLSAS